LCSSITYFNKSEPLIQDVAAEVAAIVPRGAMPVALKLNNNKLTEHDDLTTAIPYPGDEG